MRGIPGSNIDGAGRLAWRASAAFSANGQRPRDNNYMLDGVDNNETWLQTVVIFPSVDALDEFKLQTSTYSAEFGRSLGGVVNLQIKSGVERLPRQRLRVLPQRRLRRQQLLQQPRRPHQARLQAEPVRRHHRRPDRSATGRSSSPTTRACASTPAQTYLSTVPSMRMRNGDFGEINRVIYDPLTSQPFPGNVIPRNRFDPASAQRHRAALPGAEHRGHASARPASTINNYLINPTLTRNDDQFDVKVDHDLTHEQPVLRALQLPEDAARPAGDAAARRRGRDVRRRRGQHQGAELRVQRHPDASARAG